MKMRPISRQNRKKFMNQSEESKKRMLLKSIPDGSCSVTEAFRVGYRNGMQDPEANAGLLEKLFNALNSAHAHIDPRESPRTDKICLEALKEYEKIREVKNDSKD